MLDDMPSVFSSSGVMGDNEAAFETCLTGALRILASLEFSGLLGEERPTREMLLAFAEEIERHAQELAVVAGGRRAVVRQQGRAWVNQLMGVRDDPLQAAY